MSKFTENSTAGHPALALISTRVKDLKGLDGSGKINRYPVGYVRAIARIPQAETGGENAARRDLLSIFGKMKVIPKGWRIAKGAVE